MDCFAIRASPIRVTSSGLLRSLLLWLLRNPGSPIRSPGLLVSVAVDCFAIRASPIRVTSSGLLRPFAALPRAPGSTILGVMVETNPVVIRMWRGDAVESIHRGAWVATDVNGSVLASLGDPHQPIYPRSATKAFQALPLLLSGAADAFGFDDGDLALAMASHSGESMHVERVLATLERLDLKEDALRCGPQKPIADWSTEATRRASMNCSGKHVGFLAVARQLDVDPATYLDPDGSVQRAVYDATKRITGAEDHELSLATDGCSAPTFRMPLARLAQGIARVANPAVLDDDVALACRRMIDAATKHPELIGGSKHRSDTDLMRVTNGRLFAKVGAEAVLVVGDVGGNAAFAMKIDDGGDRGIAPFMLDVLVAAGRLSDEERRSLAEWNDRDVKNHDGLVVGRLDVVESALSGA